MSSCAYIALGSNLGDRKQYLDQALQLLRKQPGIQVLRVSAYHETEPVGGLPGQGKYLNAAAELLTELEPRPLLDTLLSIEKQLGRERSERNAPRTIDLDLLLFEDMVCEEEGLVIPHPRMHERLFVLEPLAEIAPLAVHPRWQSTVFDLAQKLRAHPQLTSRELAGLRAVVTGSTSGIGQAIARELAAAGADVLVHGRRESAARSLVEQLRAVNVQSHYLLADLSNPEECHNLVQKAWETWGKINIWINNAGADTLTGEMAQWSFEHKLRLLLDVDVTATMLLARAVGQRMQEQEDGVILNMGWDQAEIGMEGDSGQLFGAAKAAVMAFTKSLAVSLAPEVRVNCLAPGWIRTAWGENASEVWQQRVLRETPLRRWGAPRDVAAVARWLVSPASAFLTGQIIRINGGAVR
ncbi:MAG: 2-amino-4-hydroxy-6-hydroxymethyldihydropteridine diphosphokinase [Gemmataceae bacterium]